MRYALALYELADERRQVDEITTEAASLERLITESQPLRSMLGDPRLDVSQSRGAIEAVLAREGFGETMRHLVGVVANNHRLGQLGAILVAFAFLVAERRGIIVAEVATAHPLSDLQRTQLRARLTEAGYGRVEIREQVDAELLGGLIVRVGSRLYDASLKSRLGRLQHAMKGVA